MERERLFNIPNVLTGLRIALILAFVAAHFGLPGKRQLALAFFIAAGLTDFLDGFIARKFNRVTWLGKLLDPLADKIMILGALACLMSAEIVPAWMMGLVIVKELYMVAGGTMLFRYDIVIASDWLGKISTFLFVPGAMMAYPWHESDMLRGTGMIILYVSIALSFAAAAHYTAFAVKKSHGLKTD